jgi:protein SCO1/2
MGAGLRRSDRFELTLVSLAVVRPRFTKKEVLMRTVYWLGLLSLSVALAVVGCGGGSDRKDGADKQYEVKGKVVAVDADKKSITLDHEDIPGLMKAMKMKFTLESAKVAEGLQPGDRVQGHLRVQSGDYIITHLRKQ